MAGLSTVDRRQLRALLATRRTLAMRHFRGRPQEALLTFLVLIVVVPIPWMFAWVFLRKYRALDAPWGAELLGVVLAGLWLAWVLEPLFDHQLNDPSDMRRLLLFPIRPSVLLMATIAGTFFETTALVSVPFVVTALIGWTTPSSAIVVVPALLLAYGTMVMSGQLTMTALAGIVRKRRFQDAAVVLSGIVSIAWIVFNIRGGGISSTIGGIAAYLVEHEMHPLDWLQWTPPGALARAVERAHAGMVASGAVWLVAGLVWFLSIAGLWWRQQVGLITGSGAVAGVRPAPRTHVGRARSGVATTAWRRGRLRELVRTDLTLMWRTPHRRTGALQGIMFPSIMLVLSAREFLSGAVSVMVPALFIMVAAMFSYSNPIAADGRGVATLLLSPVRRVDMFRAYSLTFAAVVAAPVVLVCVAITFMASPLTALNAALLAVSCFLVLAAVCSGISARHSFPVSEERKSGNSGGYALAAFAISLLQPLLAGVIWAPAWIAVIVGVKMENTVVLTVASVLGCGYGWLVYWIGMNRAGTVLLRRESEHFLSLRLGSSA